MVKRQKEKQYQSAREHRANAQLRAGGSTKGGTARRLPFDCCALTLTPYQHPVCSPQGVVFENSAILPHLLKHKEDPVSGTTMTSRDLITLHMDKDEQGRWQCPVLCKPFSDHVKIVAIRQNPPGNEANVYSYEAFQELNVKAKNYEDLISGKKFKTRDVIVLQDPDDEQHNRLRDIRNFHHFSKQSANNKEPGGNVRHSVTATRIMEKLKKRTRQEQKEEESDSKKRLKKIFTNDLSGVQMTSGKCSGSFTSTTMEIAKDNDAREATEEEILQAKFDAMRKRKKKGYVCLHTTIGDLGLELHCDIAPRTCTNFIGLVEAGKYDGTKFHRLIPNFMAQAGKPANANEPESSLWGEPFCDEFDDRLVHTGAGVVSMANAGPGTNRRQFFISFKSCNHLDRKHSVFGRVVKGLDVLQALEQVPTDKKDKPTQEIKIIEAQVLVNPVKEAEEAEQARIQERAEARRREQEERRTSALGRSVQTTSKESGAAKDAGSKSSEQSTGGAATAVGKYLPKGALQSIERPKSSIAEDSVGPVSSAVPSRLRSAPKKTTFGDFSGW